MFLTPHCTLRPVYISSRSYILWKTVAKHLPTPEQRTTFCTGVGEQLLQQMMPELQQQLQAAAQKGSCYTLQRPQRVGKHGMRCAVSSLTWTPHHCHFVTLVASCSMLVIPTTAQTRVMVATLILFQQRAPWHVVCSLQQ